MSSWKPQPREPAKTKAELREMLSQAVRNTQPKPEPEPLPKVKKVIRRRAVRKLFRPDPAFAQPA